MMHRSSKITGGVLLVAGTTIGAAMLALPVSTGMAGFWPSELLFLCIWLFMSYTAFLILEVNLWLGDGSNMITMAKRTLGPAGRIFAWASYLFLLYSLLTAYIAVCDSLTQEFVSAVFGVTMPEWMGPLPLLALFSFFVYCGTKWVDYFNRWLMLIMGIAFVVLLSLLAPHVETKLLAHVDWKYTLAGVSVVATGFGYHIIIPTLTSYLEHDVKALRRVLLIGSALPLVFYTLWQFFTLGIIPIDVLQAGNIQGANGAVLVANQLANPWIQLVARIFAFVAIVTSFLGVSLSLWDCLADGFKISKHGRGRMILYALTFLPPLGFALTSRRAFLTALEYAGAYGVVILLALLPALMVWWGRYRSQVSANAKEQCKAPGGKGALVVVILISLAIIANEFLSDIGVI